MPATPFTVCIITYNEAANLPRCLESVSFADEILVVDSYSTDATLDIAARAGCRVIKQSFLGYAGQKNFAIHHAKHPWVLCLDADEWLRPGAEALIRTALAQSPEDVAGFRLKRHTFYLGDWVNHGGWWPEHKVRLFDRQRGAWFGDLHEGVRFKSGSIRALDVEIGHLSYRDVSHHLSKVNTYTSLWAEGRHNGGAKRIGYLTLLCRPLADFCRVFVLKGGWREGTRGLVIALIHGFYVFAKYAKLWELQTQPKSTPDPSEPETS